MDCEVERGMLRKERFFLGSRSDAADGSAASWGREVLLCRSSLADRRWDDVAGAWSDAVCQGQQGIAGAATSVCTYRSR